MNSNSNNKKNNDGDHDPGGEQYVVVVLTLLNRFSWPNIANVGVDGADVVREASKGPGNREDDGGAMGESASLWVVVCVDFVEAGLGGRASWLEQ